MLETSATSECGISQQLKVMKSQVSKPLLQKSAFKRNLIKAHLACHDGSSGLKSG